jgi:ATP adenylyltransferase
MAYIQEAKEAPGGGCVFCELLGRADDDPGALILARSELGFVTLAKYPYNPGHLLVLPRRHTGDLEHLSAEENDELQSLLQTCVRALRKESQPHGFNIGLNLGRTAGAGIPDHLHWHVVPRWGGDTNFMPVVGETRVLPELLEETYRRLRTRFDR